MAHNNVCSKVIDKDGSNCNPRTFLTNPLIGVLETLSFIEKMVHPRIKEMKLNKKIKQCI